MLICVFFKINFIKIIEFDFLVGNAHRASIISTANDESFDRSKVVLMVTQGTGHTVNVIPKITNSSGQTGSNQSGLLTNALQDLNAGCLQITAKHLQIVNIVLNSAQNYGDYLDSSWNIYLATLQVSVYL